jgi:hypothetical protein
MGWASFRRAWARGAPGEAKEGRNRRERSSLLAQPGIQFVNQISKCRDFAPGVFKPTPGLPLSAEVYPHFLKKTA